MRNLLRHVHDSSVVLLDDYCLEIVRLQKPEYIVHLGSRCGFFEDDFADLHPFHRLTANKLPLEMSRSAFGELKNLYLQTDLGKLDCIGEVSGVGDFKAVLKRSVVAGFSYGQFRFLDLDALIASKNAVGRERDLLAVRSLLSIKERIGRREDHP